MSIFVILLIFSIAFYIFYKVKEMRIHKSPYQRTLVKAKGSTALGLAVLFFGINALILNPSTAIIVISAVLIVVGGYFVFQSLRMYRYFAPLAAKEREETKQKD